MKEFEKQVAQCYSTWGKTYYSEYYGDKAPYPPVHTDLLRGLLKKYKVKSLLDAGCGPASFLRDVFDLNIELKGFDLTSEMVDEAKEIFSKNQLPKENIWQGSVLDKSSFKQPGHSTQNYDAVVCTGVIPHIPETQDDVLIENLKEVVNPGGIVALEARNQLFSLFTMNRYTHDFFKEELLGNIDVGNENKELLKEMEKYFRMDLPPIRKGKEDEPGYDEVLSRTHNPLVLKQKFEKLGYQEVEVLFYHFHCVPPMFSKFLGNEFISKSIEMEDPYDWRGYFMASAFFVVGKVE